MASITESANAAKLLEAAVRLFAHKGYPATSTREIVEAAGVTKPMLYYYFRSKEGLLAAAMGHFVDTFHERLRQVIAEPRSPEQLLIELIWAHLDFCQEHKPLARLFYALYFGPDDQKNLIDLTQYAQAGHELLMDGIGRIAGAGLLRPDCIDDLAMALHGMINIWVMAALNDDVELNRELAERIAHDLLRGYRNEPSSPSAHTAG
jgi:TetR/AcrR family transcriptional regulator